MGRASVLRTIKLVHTAVWGIMAASIVAIPVLSFRGAWTATALLVTLVLLECLVLALNRMRCPLTDLAARFTDDRSDNFDIYLPLWLARYNKALFGSLFAAGLLVALARWFAR